MKYLVIMILICMLIGCSPQEEVELLLNPYLEEGIIPITLEGTQGSLEITDLSTQEEVPEPKKEGLYQVLIKTDHVVFKEEVQLYKAFQVGIEQVDNKRPFKKEGEIHVIAEGGVPPYEITLNGEKCDEVIKHLEAGHYMVKVSDHNKNTFETQINISEPVHGFVEDYEGHKYAIVKIGNQWWMAENLKAKKDSQGNDVSYRTYNDDTMLGSKYGYLYDYYNATVAFIPGWHLPSHEDYQVLEGHLGMSISDQNATETVNRGYDTGLMLQDFGSSGFNAELSGWYAGDENGYGGMKLGVAFWTSHESSQDTAYMRTLMKDDGRVYCYSDPKSWFGAVRLVKDE